MDRIYYCSFLQIAKPTMNLICAGQKPNTDF